MKALMRLPIRTHTFLGRNLRRSSAICRRTHIAKKFLLSFLDDSGTVFRNISSCVYTDFDNNPRTGPWVIGVDLAKAHDYTVITVMHLATKRVVEISRFNHIEWGVQKKMIADIGRRYIGDHGN